MPLPLLIFAATVVLLSLPVQASERRPEPLTTASLSEEIVSENCYVSREPIIDENGRNRVHVEVLCDRMRIIPQSFHRLHDLVRQPISGPGSYLG